MVKDKEKKKDINPKGSRNEASEATDSNSIWKDERFQHLVSDPRFRGLPKTQRKVKIDKRFQGMFNDGRFAVKYTVDKYGRRVNKSNAEDLKKYYQMDSSETEDDEEVEQERQKEERAITRDSDDSGDSTPNEEEPGENDALDNDGDVVPMTIKERLLDPDVDYARGQGRLLTDSSSDDESSDDDDEPEMFIDHVWGELDVEAETTNDSTRRLAVCNMDWDRIRAVDIMVLLSSFLPPGGSVLSVKIYLSEYGKERLAEEEQHGPPELVGASVAAKSLKKSNGSDGDDSPSDSEDDLVPQQDSDAEEGDEYHMEKLRQYQLNRLRYYYAVVECDSVETADKVYHECDGIEYESSATRVDLRFIPDDTSFDEDEPTDMCNELPDTNSYKPRQFTTTALQQAKVDLTWDETALDRRELSDKLTSGKLDEVSDKDLRKIIAYSSEDDDEDESDASENGSEDEKQQDRQEVNENVGQSKEKEIPSETKKGKNKKEDTIAKYKALLAEINEKEQKQKEKKYEMEFSWEVKPSAEEKQLADDKDLGESDRAKPQLTPLEKLLQKRNEKNKKRKEERKKKKLLARGVDPEQGVVDDDSDSIPDDIDMNDPYFAEEFADGDFVDTKAKKKKESKKEKRLREEQDAEREEREANELELLLDDDDMEDQGKKHFSLEKILKAEQETKSKRKRRKQLKKSKTSIAGERKEIEDNFEINVNDDRFKSVYTSHLFNIDPTDSHFKKTKGMQQLIQEKLKRRHGDESDSGPRIKSYANGNNKQQQNIGTVRNVENDETAVGPTEMKRPKKQLENTLLIKSLKRKIQIKQEQQK